MQNFTFLFFFLTKHKKNGIILVKGGDCLSFNAEIKKELSGIYQDKDCCNLATLATMIALLSEEKKTGIYLKTENATVARRISILTKKILGFETEIQIKPTKKDGKYIFTLKITDKDNIEKVKEILKLTYPNTNVFFSRIEPSFTVNQCCKVAAVQACFLSSGMILSPKKSYRLEFSTHKKQVSEDIGGILTELGFEPKFSKRNSVFVIYIKNNEEIFHFLSLLNAKRSLKKFIEAKEEKELKNRINRQLNCENANEDKTINSAVLQFKAIDTLKKNKKFEELSLDLQMTAQLRLDNPRASLAELVEKADFSITKSGLNHRLNKLIKIAQINH